MKPLYNVMAYDLDIKEHTVNSAVRTLYGFAKGGYIDPSIPNVLYAFVLKKVRLFLYYHHSSKKRIEQLILACS